MAVILPGASGPSLLGPSTSITSHLLVYTSFGMSSRITVFPAALIFARRRYWGSHPKIKRLQGALCVMILSKNRYSFFVIGLLFGEIEETVVRDGTSLQLDSETLQGSTRSAHPNRGDEDEVIASFRSLKMDIEARIKTSMWMNFLLVILISIVFLAAYVCGYQRNLMLFWARLEDGSGESDKQVKWIPLETLVSFVMFYC